MARRQTPPQSANLSVEKMRLALPRLENRISELRAFDPAKVTKRNDPKINVLENAIDHFLSRTFGEGTAEYIRYSSAKRLDTASIHPETTLDEVIQGLKDGKDQAIKFLEGIKGLFLEEIALVASTTDHQLIQNTQSDSTSQEIFIVHGSDHGTRDTVTLFLKKLKLSPIILDEEASKGRTIHQKFRDHSTVAYAVVLFTPDDVGAPADNPNMLKPRPRQNVVYELGFFSAMLNDSKVCVLYSDGVEIPSDLSGVIYIRLDRDGAWHSKLAKEMKASGIEIDMNQVLT